MPQKYEVTAPNGQKFEVTAPDGASQDQVMAYAQASFALPHLRAQESGNRPGISGPMTKYGQAQGQTQLLPDTAKAMAAKLGVPWQPEMMTGTTPEAAQYQDMLGQAYLQEGIEKTGNLKDALRYYHGGPDRRLWGDKTNAYADQVMARMTGMPMTQPGPKKAPPAPANPQNRVSLAQMQKFAQGKPSVAEDVKKSALSGLFGSMAGLNTQTVTAGLPLDMIRRAAGVADFLQNAAQGKPVAPIQNVSMPGSVAQSAIAGASGQTHQPQTAQGRAAHFIGAALPAAMAPGSVGARVANVVGPASGSFLAGELARKFNAPDEVRNALETLGGMGGAVAANVRMAPHEALPKPEAQAMRYVDRVVGSTPLENLQAADPLLTGAEAAGHRGKAALGALARREGETANALNAEVATRQLGRPDRLLSAMSEAAGIEPHAAAGDIKALVEKGRAAAAPLYEEAYAQGPVDTPKLRGLLSRPSVKKAMGNAVRTAAEEGRSPQEVGFEVSPTSGDIPDMVAVKAPTAQTWDYIKRGLDDVLEGYRDKTTGKLVLDNEGRAVVQTLKDLRGELVQANPKYGEALARSGDYLSAESAFKSAGRDILNSNLTERQFSDKITGMSAGELQAYRGGIANQFFNLAQNGRLNPKTLATPRVRAKLQLALGPEAAQRLIATASKEADMQGFERRYAPDAGSITQEMRAAMAEQDAMGGRGGRILADTIEKGPRKALSNQVMELSRMFFGPTSWTSVEARNAAGQLLMSDPQALANRLKDYRANKRVPLPQRLRIQPNSSLVAGGSILAQPR